MEFLEKIQKRNISQILRVVFYVLPFFWILRLFHYFTTFHTKDLWMLFSISLTSLCFLCCYFLNRKTSPFTIHFLILAILIPIFFNLFFSPERLGFHGPFITLFSGMLIINIVVAFLGVRGNLVFWGLVSFLLYFLGIVFVFRFYVVKEFHHASKQFFLLLFVFPSLILLIINRLLAYFVDQYYEWIISLYSNNFVLEQAKEEAKLRQEHNQHFFANTTHELRTPVSSILGFSELILTQIEEGSEKKQLIQDVENIQKSAQHLLQIINEVLVASKKDFIDNHLQKSFFTTDELLEEVRQIMRVLVAKPNNRLEMKHSLGQQVLQGSKSKIVQCLLNVVGNSTKFTQNGIISVDIFEPSSQELKKNSKIVVFEIKDNGIGMSQSQLKNLFVPFWQVAESREKVEGTGLGMSITKNLCEMMGGEIFVTSELDRGTTTQLHLPLLCVESD